MSDYAKTINKSGEATVIDSIDPGSAEGVVHVNLNLGFASFSKLKAQATIKTMNGQLASSREVAERRALKRNPKPKEYHVPRKIVYTEEVVYVKHQNRYGFLNFTGDVLLTLISSGLWLIWIFVREMRRR